MNNQQIYEKFSALSTPLIADTGSRGLFLRTATDNHPAQQLYEKCGWVRDEKFYRYDRIVK